MRAFHGDKAANQTLNRTIEETEQQNFKLERKRIPYNVLEQIVLRVTAVAVTLLSIWFFLQGSMTLFTCLMVVVSAFLVYSELESAGEMFFMLPMIDASIDRVEEIDQAPRIDEGGSIQTPKSHDIVFDHVDFSYGDRKIIDDVSFTIPEGTTTAIVGPSGSGKTTLTSLMARFWDVDSGAVKLSGIDVKEYALDILSAAAFNEDGSLNTEYLMTHTPGTGPYMFESVNETATEYTFVKNPNYWGEEPDVDRFTVKVIPESKVAAMRASEVDFIMGSDTLDANSYLELSQVEGITGVISDFDFVTEFIALNDEVAPLDDLNVRTAIQMAIDKESIAQNIYSGLRAKADSVMPADMPYCTATVPTPDYDMDGAIALLEDSGWVDSNGDGIREKDGTALSFTITYPSTGVYDNMVLFFQSSMAELGIEIKTNPIDLMAFMQQVFMEDNYEMTAYMSYWFPYDPYTFVANMYPSTDYTDPSGIYSTDPQVAKALAIMSDEDAKKLIGGLYNTDDPVVVQEIYTTALDSANESSVVIPLNYRNEYAVFNNEVIESYTFNSIPNHVDVAAIHLK